MSEEMFGYGEGRKMEITKEIKEYIDKEVQRQLADAKVQKNTPRLLGATHTKWFRDENGSASTSKMGKALGMDGVKAYRIWDCIRPIVTIVCGKSYVRQVSTEDEQFINDLADRLCQIVYDARLEYKRMKGTENE